MPTLSDHIHELRAELSCCHFTPAERTRLEVELATAIEQQREHDRAFEHALAPARV